MSKHHHIQEIRKIFVFQLLGCYVLSYASNYFCFLWHTVQLYQFILCTHHKTALIIRYLFYLPPLIASEKLFFLIDIKIAS